MEGNFYTRALARHPYAILVTTFVISTTFLVIPLVTQKFPDFTDPQLGFEARHTELSNRLNTWRNLMEATKTLGELINDPLEYYYHRLKVLSEGKGKRKNGRKNDLANDVTNELSGDQQQQHKRKKHKHDKSKHKKKPRHSVPKKLDRDDPFFCSTPTSAYGRMVISSDDERQNLWTMEGIVAQCQLDKTLRASPYFSGLCQRQENHKQKCCRSWTPANYIALMSNRSSCSEITDEDLKKVKNDLRSCSYYYRNRELEPECAADEKCKRRVPEPCYVHNAAYNLLHYLLDVRFLAKVNSTDTYDVLHTAMIVLPVAASSAALDYYEDLSSINLSYDDFRIVAMELGLKTTLFDRLLVSDSYLVMLGFCFVTLCIWFYTGSVLITLSTVLVVVFSLGMSYAFYTLVLRIKLFPFMNILAIVVAVGIGSDDAFVFCKLWECMKLDRGLNLANNLPGLVHETMSHAFPTILVTTLTTAVAFFSSMVSDVTAINCFSIFSGVTVVINFVLMCTWLPASVIVAERWNAYAALPTSYVRIKVTEPCHRCLYKAVSMFNCVLAKTVNSLRYFWFVGFLLLTVGSTFVVFRYPGLQLPDSPDFQLFDSKHLFERYDLFYSKRFWFEKWEQGDGNGVLPMRFVWGVKPVDNGDSLDPHSRGTLVFDETFDMYARESQEWLLNFCKTLRTEPFYHSTLGPMLPNCVIESLYNWMERPCEDLVDEQVNYAPCCQQSSFPYEPDVLRHCAAVYTSEMFKTPGRFWNYGGSTNAQSAGIKFRRENNTDITSIPSENYDDDNLVMEHFITDIMAIVIEYDSIFSYTLSFAEMDKFFTEVEGWMQQQLSTAPPGMRNGWFVSHLDFYELQRTLYNGTIWSIVVSMGLALTVLGLVTLNPFVSFYAIVTVSAAIIVTVAALVLMGWRLNVLESIAVSTAIGLAVDFSLHYSVSYRASTAEHRRLRVADTLRQMGGPTLMAALTSAAAGALMLPSRVLPYIQIGIFLMLIMAVSWVAATFFLCPMLAIAGPSSSFGQFSYPRFGRRENGLRSNHVSHDGNGHMCGNSLIPLRPLITNNDHGNNEIVNNDDVNVDTNL